MITRYIQLTEQLDLPDISNFNPFRVVVVGDLTLSVEKQAEVSTWLVDSGCFYMMAWGEKCSSWDDSVDHANLENYDYGDVPDDELVMTTWHENKPLNEVFWFSKNRANHADVVIKNTIILHISNLDEEEKLLLAYKDA